VCITQTLIVLVLGLGLFFVARSGTEGRQELKDRIDAKDRQITSLQTQLAQVKQQSAKDAARAQAWIDALSAALRRLGVDPATIVVVTPAQTSTASPAARATPQPTATARATTSPNPRPTPSSTCLPIPIIRPC
jgi:hypothetical protein